MGNKKIGLVLVGGALLLAGCGQKPSNTLAKMNDELCKTGDLSVMAKYSSERAKPMMGAIAAMMAEPKKAAMVKAEMQKGCAEGKSKLTVINEKIEGDRATVTYTEGTNKDQKTANLVKENGEWKIDFDTKK